MAIFALFTHFEVVLYSSDFVVIFINYTPLGTSTRVHL